MDDVKLAQDLGRMLDLLRQAGRRIAAGAHYRSVLDVFGQLELEKATLQQRRAVSFEPSSASVETIFVAVGAPADTVTVLQMHFKEGITVGMLEAELGPWRREPPEPAEVAYSSALFDARQVAPGAGIVLRAVIDEFCDRFTPQTLANTLVIDTRP